MNRVYRVVWNASIGAWVAVSENAKSKTKTKTVKVSAVAIAIASSAMMPVYADVLAGNNITVTPSGTDFVVATTDDVSLKKVTVGSVELDETTNTVKVGANTTLSTAGLNTDGSVNASILTITDSATIENGLTVANGPTALKDTSITGTLITTGNTTVGGTLGVTGATTLNNTLNVVGNTTLSNVTTTGSATIGNGLTVADGATSLKNTSITGTLTTTGNTTVGGTLGVTGATTLNNTLNVVGNTTLSNVTTTGSATIGNGLTVADGATALKNTNITGTLTTTGDTTVGGTLNVNGLATFNNGANLNSKKITGLAAGNISNASSTDAVNGGQLYTVNKNIADVLGTQLDANGTLQNLTYTVSDGKGGTQAFNNVRQAIEYITGVDTGTGTGGVGVGIKYFHTNSAAVDSQSKGLESVAIGPQAIANGTSSIAMGDQARADQENAVAIGKQSAAIGLNSIALGTSNLATGESSVALGDSSKAVAKDAIAIGRNGNASGEQAISIGAGAQAAASGALAAGGASNAGRDGAVALGQGAFANTTAGISIGQNAGAGTSQGTTNDRTDHIAIGRNSGQNVIGNRNIALGVGAGSNLSASGIGSSDDNIAIGVNAGSNLTGDDNIAIGRDANKNITAVAESVAIGSSVDATTGSTVLGYEAKASGGDYATVLGYKAKVTGDSGTALGRDSEASTNNIALGASSVANGTSIAAAYLTADTKTGGYNIVSVGQAGQERRITNVAAGANATDAVNVKQLYQAQKSVASLIGGQTGVDSATGTFTGYIIELTDKNGQTHQYKDVSSAINAVSSGAISVLPGNAVMYTADGSISNVTAGTKANDAVNLAQLNQAIADNGQHHVSINSKNPANKNNVGATADESLAIGAGVTTSNAGVKSVVIGFDAATNAKESVAIGNTSTQANGDASIAIGKTALAKSTNNIAMGTNASSNGMESIVIGTNTQIDKTTGTSDYAVGIGSDSEVQNADQAIAIGRKAIVQGDNGTAIGHESRAAKENASALGNFAKATEVSANAIGNYATASGTSANAIGDNAKATAGNANAMGKSAEATSTSSNAIGDNAKAAADNASAIGTNAQATGINANAMGKGAKASEQDASAIGTNARATGVNANAMGTGAQALRQDTLALGTSAVASGLNASAIGKSADAAGLNANAFGNGAKAGAESSNAIGTGADVSATNGFALGTNATVTHTNAIALGSGSISGNATPTASAIVNGKTYNYSGINPTSTVSVGSLGNERQIINVAAGRVSGSSTDAINGSQLFQTNEELANLANKTAQALGGGALANQATGAISAPSYTVTTNPAGAGTKTTVNNVGAALTALDTAVNQPLSFAGDTGAQISRKLGETLNVKGGATGTLAGTGNIGVVANGTNQLDIRLAETINLGGNGSVTTGSASIKNNEVKVGTNTLTDTGLKAGNVKVNTSTNDVTGLSNITWNPAGTYNSGRAATEEQLLSAQNQLNTTLTDKGFSISAQGANSDKVKLGETVDFRNTDGNLVATRSADNTINYDLAKNISVDKVTLGNIIIDKATGINAGNQKITNVKAGDVNSTSTDAVNGSQLYTAQNNVKNVLGSSTQIDATGNLTSTNIGGVTGANTVHDAIQQVNSTATNAKTQADKGLNFAVNGVSPADNVQLGETVNFANGTNTTATYDAATNTYKYSLNDTLSLSNAGSLSIKDSAGTGTIVSVDKTGVQSGSIKLDASTGKITGVTDGLVAAGSKDAVNGGQLDAVKAIANTGWKLTTDKTGTGAVAGNSVEQITPDETVTFIAGDNIAVEQAGNKVTVATKKDVVFDSVTAGGTVINNAGLSFVDGTGTLVANSPSISKTGINAGNQKITNVKAGDVNSTSTDAVNGSQLYTAQNNVKNVLGSSTQIDATGNLTSTNIGGVTGANTVHDAIQQVNSTATNAKTQADKGLNFAVNGVSPADNVQLGETVNFANGTNTTATYDAATNTYKYSLNDTLSLSNAGSLSIKDSAGTGTVVSVDKTGVQSGSIKLDASTGKITGVTDGLVAAGSKEAVNGGQLDAVKAIANTGWKLTTDKTGTGAVAGNSVEQITPDETVTFIAGDNIAVEQAGNKVTVATKKDVVFDSVTAGGTVINNAGLSFVDGTGTLVANSPSISKTGINAGNQKITNVKAGDVNSTSTDAVNGSQLYTAQNNVKNVLGSSTQIDATGNLTSTNIGGVTGANTVHDAIQQVNSTATNAKTQADKGLNFAVNGVSPADNVQLGETVNFANGTNTTATYDAATNTYKYSLNDTLSLSNAGSLSIKDSAGTGTVVSVDKTGVQSGSIKLDASTGKITGVTDGLVAAGSKEAVNGGQLDAVKAIANTGWKLTTDKTGTGAVAGNSVEQITPDETVTFIAGDNIAVEQAGNKVTVATKKDVVFDSVTAGGTVINNAGLSFVDGTGTLVANSPSISKTGINAGNQKITNVKAGDVNSTSTDAVNGSQLYTAQNNVKNVLGSSTQIDATGNLTSTNIGGVTGANTVHDAIQQVNSTATNAKTQADKGLNFAVNGVSPADNVQLGETVNFANGTNTTATYDAATNTYKYSLNDTLSLSNAGSLSIKDSAGTGTVVSVDKTGVQSGSIKLDASTGKITGVTDGLVAAGSKEAVNGGQLDAVKAIANTGWKLTTDKTGTGAVAGNSVEQITPDETVTFIAGDNIAVEQAGNKVTVATKKDVVFDRVTSTDILGNTSILSATGIITQDKDGKKSASLSNTGLFVAEMNATGNTLSSSSLEAGKLTVKGTNTLVLDSVKGTLTGLSNKTLGSGDFASQGRAATEEQLNRAQSNVASILGGNAANNGGLLSMSNIGGTGESTIDDAIKSVNQVANNANKGWNVSTNGGTANNVKPNDTVDFSNKDGNVTVSNQGNNITVDLNKDIDLGAAGSVTTGDTKIDNNGLTIAGGPSVTKNGIDAGKQKVTNVADGKITADSQDAVNGGQIHDMMGAGAYDTNGNLSNIGGTGQSNINDAIAAVNKTAVQSKSTVTEGSNIKVVSNSNADGSTNYTVSTADDITLNSVTAKDINAGTVTTDKVVAGNTTVDSSGLSIKNGPSVTASGIDAGSKVVSNVSNGVQNSDAVNMGQLSQYLGGGAGYNNITQSFDAPNYQVNGGSYNNVGDALGALNQADQALGNRITNLGDQLQQAFYSTNQRIDDVEKKANAGIAAAMALENAPYIPGKYTYAAGAAYHGGENAIGLTLRKTADNGRWSLTGGVAAGSSGDPSVRVGISGVID